jgi:hypothetical protein
MTDSPDKLTTDPPRPPGTPDVDDLVGAPSPEPGPRLEPGDEDVTGTDATLEEEDADGDPVTVEPPD